MRITIHGGRNRNERASIGGVRSAGTGVYTGVHEDADNVVAAQANLCFAEVKRSGRSQHRTTSMLVCVVGLCRHE